MSTETAQDVLDNNLTCQVDDVVVWYQIGKQNLHYLDVSQAVSNNTLVQFWKHSEGKKNPFSIKDEDTNDSVSIESITSRWNWSQSVWTIVGHMLLKILCKWI